MDIAKPLLRLLLACILLIASPLVLGMNRLPLAWLLAPGAVLTYLSCHLQGYRQPRLVAMCGASILGLLIAIYALAYVAVGLL